MCPFRVAKILEYAQNKRTKFTIKHVHIDNLYLYHMTEVNIWCKLSRDKKRYKFLAENSLGRKLFWPNLEYTGIYPLHSLRVNVGVLYEL